MQVRICTVTSWQIHSRKSSYIVSVCFSGSIKYAMSFFFFFFFCPECFQWFMYFYSNFVHCSTDFLSEHESCNPTTQNQWPLTGNRWIGQLKINRIRLYYKTTISIVWNFWTVCRCPNVVLRGKLLSDVICVVFYLTL